MLCCVLVGHRPAGRPCNEAEALLEVQRVDLHHRTVDVVAVVGSARLDQGEVRDRRLDAGAELAALGNLEAKARSQLHEAALTAEVGALGQARRVAIEAKRCARRLLRVEVADQAPGGVPSIDVGLEPGLRSAAVELLEAILRHHDLAAARAPRCLVTLHAHAAVPARWRGC